MAKKTIAINVLANWSSLLANIVITFFLTPILVSGLGDRRYGIWSLVESIIAYLTLFDLGIAASVVRFAARFEGLGDRDQLNRVACTSLALFAGAGAIVLSIAGGLLAGGWPWGTIPGELTGEARAVLLLLALNLSLRLALGVFPSLLEGLQLFSVKAAIRTAMLVVRAAATVIILRRGGGLVELIATYLSLNLIEHTVFAGTCWYFLPSLRITPRLVDRKTFLMIRGYSVNAFLVMIAGRISFQTDALVISMFLAPEFIAYFAIGAKLIETSKNVLTSLTSVLTPTISQLDARGDSAGVTRIFLDVSRIATWLLAPVVAGLITLGGPFLTLWVGPSFAAHSYPVLAILALSLILMAVHSTSSRILYGVGRLSRFTRLAMIQAFANLALSLLFVRPFGIQGVAWGTSIPYILYSLMNVMDVSRFCGVSWVVACRYILVRPIASAVILGVIWQSLAAAGAIASYGAFFLVGASGTIGFAIAAILTELGPKTVVQHLKAARMGFPGMAVLPRK